MLRYSLMMLLLAHCVVNDGDATKNVRLVSVDEALSKPVVGLPLDNGTKAANTTQDAKVTQSSLPAPTNSNPSNATQDSSSTESSNVDQIASITEMGDAMIKKNDTDAKLTKGTNAVDHQVSDATKATIEKESAEKTDIKDPTPAVHLDNKDSPASNGDGEHSSENSGEKPSGDANGKDGGDPSTASTSSKNVTNPAGNESENESPKESGETETTTTLTEEPTVQTEEDPSSPSTASTTEKTSTTEESVSPPSTASSATEAAVTEASAAEVEAKPEDEGMSSGVVALVMAIVFAIIVVIVYVGLLLWRRYLEYRYGTRELLVNDLEFDTNDLRHFEL